MPKPTFSTPQDFLATLLAAKPFKELVATLRSGGTPPLVGGVTGSLFSMLVAGLREREARPLVVLTPTDEEAASVALDLDLLGHPPIWFPAGSEGFAGRMRALSRLGRERNPFLVAPLRAVLDPQPSPTEIATHSLEINRGAKLDRDAFLERLTTAGYRPEALVDRGGTFSVRGDLVDVFLHDRDRPVRIEFFDDEVEDLRAFDPSTQLTTERLEGLATLLVAPDTTRFSGSFGEHLDESALLVTREAVAMDEACARHSERADEADRARTQAAFDEVMQRPHLVASRLKLSSDDVLTLGGQVVVPEGTTLDSAFNSLERASRGKRATMLCFDTEAERDRFIDELEADALRPDSTRKTLPKKLVPVVASWSSGFHSPMLGIAMVSHRELFATPMQRRPRSPDGSDENLVTRAIEHFLDLEAGDFVVHLTRGIARFDGLETIEKAGARQDFLRLTFRGEVTLLVPAARIELVQKYIGGKGEAPELSKLGSASWDKRKAAVEKDIGDLAAELLEMQALRMRRRGIQHPIDTAWQQEFEAAFPHELTPDQAKAVEAIRSDMESPRPMDRLLCGDVGYGKTEVAMRAAFKAVMGNRQVAVLVPTTVLAQQHLDSFRERMADYPIIIEGLSRFRTAKQSKAALQGLAEGSVDIVIGTHRLVQSDVEFQNLGLVIVDEEQRFGVTHKERLRKLRLDVDILTLSATPIPRTLHQALVGIRDISPLTQAPRGRRSVESEVVTYSDELVRRAVLRELDRGGQVFFVHNRVQTIEKVAQRLGKLVPEARIIVGHGQMPERALERTMLAFIEKKADILVATTIIESGLDIPSANTIFIDRADAYGLSDLHQLRGRVGRYHNQAYAYFMVAPDRVISDIGEKRLRAIEEFSRLGSGFQISMRDMEIRGAGNILGSEQSGHIAAVGYDLYCRLLDRAVRRLRNEDVPSLEEAEMDLDVTAFLPDGFIPDPKQRIELYRKLGRARAEAEFVAIIEELRDRYGRLPEVAEEFVVVARIRALLERVGVRQLQMAAGEGLFLLPGRRKLHLPGLAPDRVRPLSNGRTLLARPEPFSGPRELFVFLAGAFQDRDAIEDSRVGNMRVAEVGAARDARALAARRRRDDATE